MILSNNTRARRGLGRRIVLWAVILLICVGVGYSLHPAGKTAVRGILFRLDAQSLQLIPWQSGWRRPSW